MNEIERILKLEAEKRTQADLDYLEAHLDELSQEQILQLDKEEAGAKKEDKKEAVKQEKKVTLTDKNLRAKADFIIETKDLGEGEVEAVVATDSLDRHGERLDIDGLNITKYKKNNVVLWSHNSDMLPIAKATKVWKEAGKLLARMTFAIENNPFAQTVYDLIKGGFINAVSIGFMPLEMEGNTYTKSEMIEFSIVPVPANAEALITAKKMGIDTSIFQAHNKSTMYVLADIVKKEVEGLTQGEIKFLKENIKDLTGKQVEKFTAVLVEKKDDTKEKLEALEKELADLKKNDKANPKNINIGSDTGKLTKEMKFLYYARGLQSGDFSEYIEKAGMTTTNTGVVIPPVEFIAEVERLEEQVGAARPYVTIRKTTSGAGVRYIHGNDDLQIFDTAEAGVKKTTKLTYTELLLGLRKFAGILAMTDELAEDAAFDIWRDATQRFARAFSRKEDELVFTNVASGGVTTNGIIHVSGTHVVDVGATLANLDYDDLVNMIYGVPSQSGDNGRFFFNRGMLGVLAKIKDDNKRPIWSASVADGLPATILGRPYTETAVLGDGTDTTPDAGFIVYGDLKYVTLAEKSTLDMKMFDSGTVGDPDDADQSDTLNLLTQDMQALRAVKRMNAVVRFPAAFSVAKTTGTS